MTREEIKALKVGDKFNVTLEVTAAAALDCFNELVLDAQPVGLDGTANSHSFSEEVLSVVPTPHTFEVGDTVRIIPDPLSGRVHGGHYSQQLIDREGVIESIAADDDENTMWLHVDGYDHRWGISPHCLELVKKALKDKYKVINLIRTFEVVTNCTNGSIGSFSVASFNIVRHPNAEAAAKAECDRLNAEWRKQQEGGEA